MAVNGGENSVLVLRIAFVHEARAYTLADCAYVRVKSGATILYCQQIARDAHLLDNTQGAEIR
jgi:hypothetical protein